VQNNKTYAGANGGKISVLYNGEQYMLKFPPFPTITELQKEFYKTMLTARKESIIDFPLFLWERQRCIYFQANK
jgi:hypothetical protein